MVPDKGKSQENSAKVATELTQEGVGTSKLPEPECGVLLVVPAEQEGLDHVDTHGKELTESIVTSDALEESENDRSSVGPAVYEDHDNVGTNQGNLTKIDDATDQVDRPEANNPSQTSPNNVTSYESVKERTDYYALRFPKGKWPKLSGETEGTANNMEFRFNFVLRHLLWTRNCELFAPTLACSSVSFLSRLF